MSNAAAEVRPASARSEATRKRVVEAAIACIAEEGFQASNLSRIARYAGMTTGAIQHQFADKAALLAEVVERGFEQMIDRLARMPGGEDPLAARVSKLVEALWSGYDAAGTRAG